MNRRFFIGSLALQWLLLVLLCGVCIWSNRRLTTELKSITDRHQETNRVLNDLGAVLNRTEMMISGSETPDRLSAARSEFEQTWGVAANRLQLLHSRAENPVAREKAGQLTATSERFASACRELLSPTLPAGSRRTELRSSITTLSGEVRDRAEQLGAYHATLVISQRDTALLRTRKLSAFALACTGVSLVLLLFTIGRLNHSIFLPLQKLRASIRGMISHPLETVVPVEGAAEIREVAIGCNDLAREFHHLLADVDERARATGRISQILIEALPYPLYVVDADFLVRQTNHAAAELNQKLKLTGVLPDAVRRLFDEAISGNGILASDDIRRAVHLSAAPADGADFLPQFFRLPNAFGLRDGWAVLLIDVSHLRRNAETNAKTSALLGHDVKTPLTGIRLSLLLLLEEKLGALNPSQRELLEVGRDECERMLTLLEALLELARWESGRVELHLSPVAPADLVTEAAAVHGEKVQKKGTELHSVLRDHLPMVLADSQLINRVLGILLSNAGNSGTKGREIVLRADSKDDGFVRFSVVNHGQPLTDSERNHIFDPFSRRRGSPTDTPLALALCREIVSLHGGKIGVSSPADTEQVEFFFDLRCAKTIR